MSVNPEVVGKSASRRQRDVHLSIAELNASFVRVLIEMAQLDAPSTSDFIATLRVPLLALATPSCALAARMPVLLLEIESRNATWWKAASVDPLKNFAAQSASPILPRARAVKLTRSTLTLAWHLSRTDRENAVVSLGMSAPVIALVSALQPSQIDAIAERQYAHLRPRWMDHPALWKRLLSSPANEPDSVRSCTYRLLQLSYPCRYGAP
jgi:hypothetical protein